MFYYRRILDICTCSEAISDPVTLSRVVLAVITPDKMVNADGLCSQMWMGTGCGCLLVVPGQGASIA